MGNITLRQIRVNNKVFNTILESFPDHLEYTEDLRPYYKGYEDKRTIRYNEKYMICTLKVLNSIYELECDYQGWKQVILRNIVTQLDPVKPDITGTYAWNYMMNNVLLNFYTEDEVDSVLASYKTTYDDDMKQFHILNWKRYDYIQSWDNCYYYDINGAHTDALCDIFPKAKEAIIELNEMRHENPNIKSFFNYFVGMFKHKGYEGAYNYIVQRTTNKLLNGINNAGGLLLYANTDGFVVQNPDKKIKPSKNLGEFKLEYKGTVYTYWDKNYWCIQLGNDIKGNVLSEAKLYIDLSKRRVVHYDRVKTDYGFVARNIEEEILHENNYKKMDK